MNKYALAAALALAFCGAAQATVIDLVPAASTPAAQPGQAYLVPNVAVAPASRVVRMSELPEPEVFAMMLVGLILIGYRASRDSDEKFK